MIEDELREEKLVIFGTGHVGVKFYNALKARGMQRQVLCFTRTKNVDDGEAIDGIPVYCFEDVRIDSDILVCLAVHEAIRDEIEEIVRKRTDRYLWIYPYLYSFMLGTPEQKNMELDIGKLLDGFRGDLRLGVRLAVIEQQEGRNTYGFDAYVRALMTYCGKDTAEERLAQFRRLITRWKQTGYDKDCLIGVNRRYEVIDGNHRLSMAVYMKQRAIYGDIYPTDLSFEEIHGYEPLLSEKVLLENGFEKKEIERLKKTQERYLIEYERK